MFGFSSMSETLSKYFLWTTITKSPFSGKGCRIPAGMFFKSSIQKAADPIPCILQDTDLHFLCTLMKEQPSCLPPLIAPLILTTVCSGVPPLWRCVCGYVIQLCLRVYACDVCLRMCTFLSLYSEGL